MNLQPFYELRDRLLVSAAAGTQFVQEDFRLREAAKKLEVFAKASPVFAKMSQMLGQLIDGEKEKKTEVLLDLLGLLDAFLTTQGSSQTEGELLPAVEEGKAKLLVEQGMTAAYQEIPYSRLQPIKWALTETGSSRQSTLEENYEREPELFMDFRIFPLMVKALGDVYAEIGEMVCGWLIKIGEPVLPLLKEGFLPKGKKEMVRRVRAISEIAGARENDFYCAQIPESEKEVKEALIRALRYSQENRQILLDLLKTEKGKMRTTVQWTLGFMEGEEVVQYWEKRAASNPLETAQLLRFSKASYAPAILAALLREDGEALLREDEERARQKKEEKKGEKADREEKAKQNVRNEKFKVFIYACTGKIGREIMEMLEWSAKEEGLKRFRVTFAEMMADTIMETTIDSEEARQYYQLAQQLFEQVGREYVRPAFAASLLSAPPDEAYTRFSGCMETMGYSIFRVLQRIYYRKEKGYFLYIDQKTDERGNVFAPKQIRVLNNGLDLRWYTLIMANRKNCPRDYFERGTSFMGADAVLYRLLRKDIPDLCQQYGEYFYHQAVTTEPKAAYVALLVQCGWTKFDGILYQAAKKDVWSYELKELINVLPISQEQLTDELEMILKHLKRLAQRNSPNRRVSFTATAVKKWLEILHNGGTVDELV